MAEQANISLTIGADGAQAETALLKAEAAERKLEAAVKSGNRTAKLRANTLGELEQGLAKLEARERQYANAQQKRAAASLAAQKSRALLAEMEAKASRERRMATGWEQAAANAMMEADRRNHERAMKRKAEMAAAMNRNRDLLGELGNVAQAAGGSLIAVGGAAAGLRAVANEVARINEALVQSAKSANQTSGSIREFVALQAPGAEGTKFVGESLLSGAQRGVKPAQAAALAQTIQSINDTDGDGILQGEQRTNFDTDYGAALKLIEAGVAQEDATKVITAGKARGQSGAVSADLMARAAEVSALGPSDVAKSISATSEFSDQKEALAVLTALSKEQTETGKLPAAMERLGVVLGKSGEVGETEKFSKKYGLVGLSETQKIEALRKYGAKHGSGATEAERIRSFTATLPGEEGLSKETAIDLARVVRQSGTASATRADLEAGAEGKVDAMLGAMIASPITGPGILANRQAALGEVGGFIGPQSEKAQAALARRQIEGAAMIQAGDVANLEADGTAKPFQDRTWGAWLKRGLEGIGRSASVGYGAGPGVASIAEQNRRAASQPQADQAGILRVQEELVSELRKNNELLSQNNAAMATGAAASKPAGGAASNAEERY